VDQLPAVEGAKAMNRDDKRHTIISAQPGWFVAGFVASSANNVTDPIIAWCITDDEVIPVTCAGPVKVSINVIKRPDGLLTIPMARDEAVREQ
jgi:hypothetical protein